MIELTRLSNLHRAILAGSDSLELYLAPRRRGFIRVSTTETCRIPKGQHAVSLITGQNSREQTGEVVQFILKRDLERAYSRRRRGPPTSSAVPKNERTPYGEKPNMVGRIGSRGIATS
jgi:hypothetical protein